jgi:heterodisulfide reductase subunit A
MAEKGKGVIAEAEKILDKEKVVAKAKEILDQGYDGIIGLRRRWGHVGPYLFTSKEDLQELELEPRYSLATFLRQVKDKWPEKKFGAILRGCDERALKNLEKIGAFNKDGLVFIGITCSMEQAEECNCEKPIYNTLDCTGCWKCIEKCEKKVVKRINVCPILIPDRFNMGLSQRKAIYLPFPQAVPKKNVRDAEHCLRITEKLECKGCENVCEPKAIVHDMTDQIVDIDVGAIVVATGLDLYDVSKLEEYGYGRIKNVITAMEFERLTAASGPTMGELRRPSDGRIPENIAFIQCVGSRDFRNKAYCSSVCCMHSTKEAMLAFEHHSGTRSTIFYMDMRAVGKRFQEYIARAMKEYNVTYIRGRPGRIEVNPESNPIIWYEETTSGQIKSFEAELVVLAQAMVPQITKELANILGIELDEDGFVKAPDKLLQPLDTTKPGIFACGYVHSPRDIPDSVTQASGAAGRAAEAIASLRSQGGK